MIFYRSDCADMALSEADIDEAFIASAGAIVVTGTHFSTPNAEAAQLKAIRIARANGRKVVFDIDYRPNLWGLAGHEAGFSRYVKSDYVTGKIKPILKDCDLIVGTEEEVLIAAGESDLLKALKAIRAVSSATIVLKRGAMGCIVYDGKIADDLEAGILGMGFPIEVYNVLGAGDAFMSGFLRGWLDRVLMAVNDTLLAFPGILLALGLMAVIGPNADVARLGDQIAPFAAALRRAEHQHPAAEHQLRVVDHVAILVHGMALEAECPA